MTEQTKPKYTELRHRMLATATQYTYTMHLWNDTPPSYSPIGKWSYVEGRVTLTLNWLQDHKLIRSIMPQHRPHAPREIRLTELGRKALTEWNEKFGQPTA